MRLGVGLIVGWLLAGLLGLTPPAAYAQTPPPDLRTYENWLREAFTAAQRRDRLGLEEVAPRLIATREALLPDGSSVPVDNRWLAEALARPDPDFPPIAARLGALIDALAQPDPTVPADARQRLRDLLSRPPFTIADSRDSLLGGFLDWLFRQLSRLFEPFGALGPGPANALGWLIAILGVLLVIGLLIYWLLGLRGALAREAQAAAADDPEANLTSNTALQQAGDLARGGDYRTAVRYLYLSSLLWLDERGMLRYDRALTNREYLERLGENAELRARLAPIIETFDRVWYGYAPLDAASFAAYQQQVEGLRKLRGGA